jgi:hypothetical protein
VKETVWIHYGRPRTRWYQLSEDERQTHRARWAALDKKTSAAGAVRQGVYSVRGQGDFSTLEVWSFDTVEQAFDYWAARVSLGYAEWFSFSNQLGTELQPEAPVAATRPS